MRELVAERGFHGASMATVARRAGVAAGTAYVHYPSKDEVILAAYLEAKQELGQAAAAHVVDSAPARARFDSLWRGAHAHLQARPETARFLLQVEVSPYAALAHERAHDDVDNPLIRAADAPDMAGRLVPLPPLVQYDLALGPAVRLCAAEVRLEPDELTALVESCWRALTR